MGVKNVYCIKSGAERERERESAPDLNNKTQRLGWPGLPQIYCLAFHVKMSLSISLLLLLHRMERLAIIKYIEMT